MTWRDKERFAVFAGTTEGREICRFLLNADKKVNVYVATEYGKFTEDNEENLSLHVGRMDEQQMMTELKRLQCDMVIDATHPYACIVSENISKCCENLKLECVRILRESCEIDKKKLGERYTTENSNGETYYKESDYGESSATDKVIIVENMQKAAEYLALQQGNIFLTTGSKELEKFTVIPNYQERLYVRVLPSVASIQECLKQGLQGKHIIGMQGPFSVHMNMACFLECHADFVVTKESGDAGGFKEKLEAAEKAGCRLIVVERPKQGRGMTLKEFCEGNCEGK